MPIELAEEDYNSQEYCELRCIELIYCTMFEYNEMEKRCGLIDGDVAPDDVTVEESNGTNLYSLTINESCGFDACHSNPCKNGGTCFLKGHTTTEIYCECIGGYSGRLCSNSEKNLAYNSSSESQILTITLAILNLGILLNFSLFAIIANYKKYYSLRNWTDSLIHPTDHSDYARIAMFIIAPFSGLVVAVLITSAFKNQSVRHESPESRPISDFVRRETMKRGSSKITQFKDNLSKTLSGMREVLALKIERGKSLLGLDQTPLIFISEEIEEGSPDQEDVVSRHSSLGWKDQIQEEELQAKQELALTALNNTLRYGDMGSIRKSIKGCVNSKLPKDQLSAAWKKVASLKKIVPALEAATQSLDKKALDKAIKMAERENCVENLGAKYTDAVAAREQVMQIQQIQRQGSRDRADPSKVYVKKHKKHKKSPTTSVKSKSNTDNTNQEADNPADPEAALQVLANALASNDIRSIHQAIAICEENNVPESKLSDARKTVAFAADSHDKNDTVSKANLNEKKDIGENIAERKTEKTETDKVNESKQKATTSGDKLFEQAPAKIKPDLIKMRQLLDMASQVSDRKGSSSALSTSTQSSTTSKSSAQSKQSMAESAKMKTNAIEKFTTGKKSAATQQALKLLKTAVAVGNADLLDFTIKACEANYVPQEELVVAKRKLAVLIKIVPALVKAINEKNIEQLSKNIHKADREDCVKNLGDLYRDAWLAKDKQKKLLKEKEKAEKKAALDHLEEVVISGDIGSIEKAINACEAKEIPENKLTTAREIFSLLQEIISAMEHAMAHKDKALLDQMIVLAEQNGCVENLGSLYSTALSVREQFRIIKQLRLEVQAMESANTLAELRSYQSPPDEVHDVMTAVYLILGEREESLQSWDYIKRLLARSGHEGLRSRAMHFKVETLTSPVASRARAILRPYSRDSVAETSPVASKFYSWAVGMVDVCHKLHAAGVKPLSDSSDGSRGSSSSGSGRRSSVDSRRSSANMYNPNNQRRFSGDSRRTSQDSGSGGQGSSLGRRRSSTSTRRLSTISVTTQQQVDSAMAVEARRSWLESLTSLTQQNLERVPGSPASTEEEQEPERQSSPAGSFTQQQQEERPTSADSMRHKQQPRHSYPPEQLPSTSQHQQRHSLTSQPSSTSSGGQQLMFVNVRSSAKTMAAQAATAVQPTSESQQQQQQCLEEKCLPDVRVSAGELQAKNRMVHDGEIVYDAFFSNSDDSL